MTVDKKNQQTWLETAQLAVGALNSIATWIKYLGAGQNASQMGAVEFLGVCVKESGEAVAAALHDVAEAIREHTRAW